MKRIFATLVLLFLHLSAAIIDKPMIEVNSYVDSSLITIGDLITYTITIDYADSLAIEKPGEGVHLGQFEIKNYTIHEPVQKDNRIFQKYEYVISVYDTGRFVIPPFPIAYFPKDSVSRYQLMEASAIPIYVKSVIADEERELRDIKKPLEIPFNYLFVVSLAVIAVLVLVIGYLAYKFYKKRKQRGHLLKTAEPLKPAHEIALADIEYLLAERLLEKGEIKVFYSRLSEIIRRYIENRFYVLALEETSAEILAEVKEQDLSKEPYDLLQDFLELSDFVKFAKYIPSESESVRYIEMAKQFITDTMIILNQIEVNNDESHTIETKHESINQNN
jgi:hypothetical protein